MPYIDLDGTGDYLSVADNAAYDISGIETYIAAAARGMTMGLWISPDRATNAEHLFGKRSFAAGNYSYWIANRGDLANDPVYFRVSVDGTALSTAISNTALNVGAWNMIVCRYIPSVEQSIWINGVEDVTLIAGIPASIFNGNGPLTIGAITGANNPTDGQTDMAFICAQQFPDAMILSLFHQQRALYGV